MFEELRKEKRKEIKKQLLGVLTDISANADRIVGNLDNTITLKINIRMSAGEVPTYTEKYYKFSTNQNKI